MKYWSESQVIDQRFRSLLSSAVSGKGLLIQAATCQFALPAVASVPSSEVMLDPVLPDVAAESYSRLASDAVVGTESEQRFKSVSSESVPLSQSVPAIETTTTVPIAALAKPPSAAVAIASAHLINTELPSTETLIPARPLQLSEQSTTSATDSYVFATPHQGIEQLEVEPLEVETLAPEQLAPEQPRLDVLEEVSESAAEATQRESEDSEFSWFSLDGLARKENAEKLAFVTQLETSPIATDETMPVLIAGPQDLNPGLNQPSDPLLVPDADSPPDINNPLFNNSNADPGFSPDNSLPQPIEPFPENETSVDSFGAEPTQEEQSAFVEWDDLEVGLNSDFDNFGQSSWSILPEIRGQLANGNQIGIASGFSQFEQDGFESVGHTPVTLSWKSEVDNVEIQVSGGVDLFNRLPADTHFSAIATTPVSRDAFVSAVVEQGPHLFNAQTLENEISRWHYGPEVYWQISSKMSFFSKVRLGNYSDGNWEQQSFFRLGREIGQDALVAINVTNQSFQKNVENTSGYFSPSDFLVATAEMSWQEQIADELSCGLLGSIGQQRLEGEWALAYSAQAVCTVNIASAVELDLGYQFSNVSNDQSALVDDSAYRNQQIIGGIQVRF